MGVLPRIPSNLCLFPFSPASSLEDTAGEGGDLSRVGLPPLDQFKHSDAVRSMFASANSEVGNLSERDWTDDQRRAV